MISKLIRQVSRSEVLTMSKFGIPCGTILPIFQSRLLEKAAILTTGGRSTIELQGNINFKMCESNQTLLEDGLISLIIALKLFRLKYLFQIILEFFSSRGVS